MRPRSAARYEFDQKKATPEKGGFSRVFQKLIWPPLAVLLTVLLYTAAFPTINLAETAYLFALPFLLWAFTRPSFKIFSGCALAAAFLSWVILLWWLRHVTYVGTFALALYTSLYFFLWLLAVWWVVPRLEGKPFLLVRLPGLLGLAGLWVVLEHLRGILFTGFPWLPLAASQWDRPALLQVLALTGSAGLSFILIFFNLGLAFYLRRILGEKASRSSWYERICPEFYVALTILLCAVAGLLWSEVFGIQSQKLFTASAIQPYIKQSLKWDPAAARTNLETIEKYTLYGSSAGGELVLWPESVTPWPIKGDPDAQSWAERLSRDIGKPILMGNMAVEGETWYNIVCAVTPENGFKEPYYAKRRLVPFGEYIPFQRFLPFVEKVVPIGDAFGRGYLAQIIPLKISNTNYRIGSLICYEDIFSSLSRQSVRAGVDFLFVATNNAWYGEEAGAYQHAVHSVLRAVETRRPVVRCGNGGWSGWIDEFGNVRHVLRSPDKDIYFRGSDLMEIKRDARWASRLSFYVRYGDWFIILCGLFVLVGYFSLFLSTKEKSAYRPGDLLRPVISSER